MIDCPICGCPKHVYGPTFVALWEQAMRCFPLYALPEPHTCVNCMRAKAGLSVPPGYWAHRKEWLESVAPVPVLDLTDKDVIKQLAAGQRVAKSFKKLLADQKKKMLRIRTKRFMKKYEREYKARQKAIREVLERAAEICSENADAGQAGQ